MRIVNLDSIKPKMIIPRGRTQSNLAYAVYAKGWKDATDYIANNAVEVPAKKTGQWVSMNTAGHLCKDRYECSNCGFISEKIVTAGGNVIDQLSNYCPDCGADMREIDE